jgi:hypothetical protein
MVGVTSIDIKESLDELAEQLRQTKSPRAKERLQVLYWLKQEKAPSMLRNCQGESEASKHIAKLVVDVPKRWSRSNVGNQDIIWGSTSNS